MRIPEYLSPTSIKLFYDDIEEFYMRYLSDVRRARDPQTQPMSIGSAFDAYVKSYLHEKIFGKGATAGGPYELETIFENQVEAHNRDWAWEHGKRVFEEYKKIGCLADLMLELGKAIGPPRFEFDVKGEIEGVPLLGKPDVFFINEQGARVIYDWKVNGYCGKALKSPMKGYLKLREGITCKTHKDCYIIRFQGIDINVGMTLEEGDQGWASQLAIYGWLLGEPVGSEQLITGIDQICGPASRLRFASHRLKVSPDYQFALLENITNAWDIILSDWIFRDMDEESSRKRCLILDQPISEEYQWMLSK
ncbi:MAG: PD-(D/E)XK nuclease family protein [Clostridia bacterium]|jgi:hypothetical protein